MRASRYAEPACDNAKKGCCGKAWDLKRRRSERGRRHHPEGGSCFTRRKRAIFGTRAIKPVKRLERCLAAKITHMRRARAVNMRLEPLIDEKTRPRR